MNFLPDSGSGYFKQEELVIPLSEVARYAGGSRYRMDSKMEAIARSMLQRAKLLSRPAFGYSIRKIIDTIPDKGILIENDVLIPLPTNIPQELTHIVTVVCTIGPDLEKEVSSLNAKGEHLNALYLDASGVALLEDTAQKAHEQVCRPAYKKRLYAGCRWEPGCDKLPMEAQKVLFDLVDVSAIGVELTQSGVMLPLKSLSFWSPLSKLPLVPADRNKCRTCGLKDCIYRTISPGKRKTNHH
jgi:Vitamin B12 dependent methionine synthase, activation domain